MNVYKRAKATLVSLVRNNELGGIRDSMKQLEYAFNRKAGVCSQRPLAELRLIKAFPQYPWVFLNDEEFTDEFKAGVRQMTRSEIYFGLIPKDHWEPPDWVDKEKAAEGRRLMEQDQVIYGGSESYRKMCRFNSGCVYCLTVFCR